MFLYEPNPFLHQFKNTSCDSFATSSDGQTYKQSVTFYLKIQSEILNELSTNNQLIEAAYNSALEIDDLIISHLSLCDKLPEGDISDELCYLKHKEIDF